MPVTWYPDPVPTYDLILQTTRAYQGNAKEGFYAPSKLINLGQWVSTNQAWLLIGSSAGFAKTGTLFSRYATDQVMADQPLADFLRTFPFTRLVAADPAITVFAQPDTSLTSVFYTGISATSSIRLTMRWTMDMIVRPGTERASRTSQTRTPSSSSGTGVVSSSTTSASTRQRPEQASRSCASTGLLESARAPGSTRWATSSQRRSPRLELSG